MPDSSLPIQVAWACRILAMDGHTDLTLGHVSARGPGGEIYIKRKDLGLNEVTPDDVLVIDLDGNKLDGLGDVHLESVLHTEVYRVRPDVGAVVHTHPPYSTALGAVATALEFLSHDAVLFHDGVAIFDETAELILQRDQGEAVARALGQCRVLLMRNHGVLAADRSIPWAVYAAITLERASRIQFIASSLGKLAPIPRETVQRMFADKFRDDFVESYWKYLVREAGRQGYSNDMPAEA
jgi:ribulose-5-phosphate 4-epimerase/fuculose-1-phosphate aldolase